MNLREIWSRVTTTRYCRLLEREVTRLRAENRALLNSILGVAGVPPLPVEISLLNPGAGSAGNRLTPTERERVSSGTGLPAENSSQAKASSGSAQVAHGAVPLRRRSWQQINRMLEFESARKKAEA